MRQGIGFTARHILHIVCGADIYLGVQVIHSRMTTGSKSRSFLPIPGSHSMSPELLPEYSESSHWVSSTLPSALPWRTPWNWLHVDVPKLLHTQQERAHAESGSMWDVMVICGTPVYMLQI